MLWILGVQQDIKSGAILWSQLFYLPFESIPDFQYDVTSIRNMFEAKGC